MLSEIDKGLKQSSNTAERSFAGCFYSTYVHSSKTDVLDLVTVAKEFVNVNSRRIRYFRKSLVQGLCGNNIVSCQVAWSILIEKYLPMLLIFSL